MTRKMQTLLQLRASMMPTKDLHCRIKLARLQRTTKALLCGRAA